MADQEIGSEPAAFLIVLGKKRVRRALAGMNRDLEAALARLFHILEVSRFVALRQPAQIDAEGDEPFERAAACEIFALDPINIGVAQRLVAWHLIDVTV